MHAKILYLHALSPLHTGSGQGVDVIDLPVARETTTNWPYIPGSSLKGALRAACDPGAGSPDLQIFEAAFGPPVERAGESAGALLFGDGRLLCLPVRSLYGTFAWLSSPLALERYRRDFAACQLPLPPESGVTALEDSDIALSPAARIAIAGKAYLEDLDLAVVNAPIAPIAQHIAEEVFAEGIWRDQFLARFGIVSDTLFSFLTEVGTEVTARIRIDESKGTVQSGALWYEEAIPAETILSAPVLAAPHRNATAQRLYEHLAGHLDGLLQIGGHASVGRGLVTVHLGGDPA